MSLVSFWVTSRKKVDSLIKTAIVDYTSKTCKEWPSQRVRWFGHVTCPSQLVLITWVQSTRLPKVVLKSWLFHWIVSRNLKDLLIKSTPIFFCIRVQHVLKCRADRPSPLQAQLSAFWVLYNTNLEVSKLVPRTKSSSINCCLNQCRCELGS